MQLRVFKSPLNGHFARPPAPAACRCLRAATLVDNCCVCDFLVPCTKPSPASVPRLLQGYRNQQGSSLPRQHTGAYGFTVA